MGEAYIVIAGPGHDGTVVGLHAGITSLGRQASNDVVLPSDQVSRNHARISWFEDKATLQDRGSHNGSYVNGERVTSRVLRDGDVCRLGNYRLDFHTGPAPAQSPSIPRETEPTHTARQVGPRSGPATRESAEHAPPPLVHELEGALSARDRSSLALRLALQAGMRAAESTRAEQFLSAMVAGTRAELAAELGALIEATADGALRVSAAHGPEGAQADAALRVRPEVARWVITKHFEVFSPDLHRDLRFPGPAGPPGHLLSVIAVPLPAPAGPERVLYFARGTTPFAEADLEVAFAAASLASLLSERFPG